MGQENTQIVIERIENLNFHISILEKDIQDNPDADVEDKPTRQDVLLNLISVRTALQATLDSINE